MQMAGNAENVDPRVVLADVSLHMAEGILFLDKLISYACAWYLDAKRDNCKRALDIGDELMQKLLLTHAAVTGARVLGSVQLDHTLVNSLFMVVGEFTRHRQFFYRHFSF